MSNAGILLATINAKWIHPSLALRLLKANLGPLEAACEVLEFALRQPLHEKTGPILAARPRILGLSVSIWNHLATLELLQALEKAWGDAGRPVIVLGGPEASYLPLSAEIFRYADFCVCGEGEVAFRALCEAIFCDANAKNADGNDVFARLEGKKVFSLRRKNFFYQAGAVSAEADATTAPDITDLAALKSGYHLYTDEDVQKKLVYVEASRGCPFACEFCLSAVETHGNSAKVREFPLEPFLAEMGNLIARGAKTFKFLDRTFNADIARARRVMEFFLKHIKQRADLKADPLVVHFEMVPSRFPPELVETLARFPAGTLRLEIGLQTLNPEVSARIGRPSNPARELEAIRLLREKTAAIIHADLVAGLPGEDMASFGRGFDALHDALYPQSPGSGVSGNSRAEIQLGILKLLPGAPIARHTAAFGMRYNPLPPYELLESAALPAADLDRLKNFARFWELIVNRGLIDIAYTFERFMSLADTLLAHFGRNWGIPKNELLDFLENNL